MQDPQPEPISFEGVLVVVGGGSFDAALLRELAAEGAHLVGADGGGDAIAAAGLVPEAIIGDLDSLRDPEGWAGRTILRRIEEQDTTDFEKVLYSTRAPVTVALGMTGKRFDHTLAALDAVARHARARRIILVDEEDIAVGVAGPFAAAVDAGERVSVHPLGSVTFASSTGLKYALAGVVLAPGLRTGTSNEAVSGHFSMVPAGGAQAPYLIILSRRYLRDMVATATFPRRQESSGPPGTQSSRNPAGFPPSRE